MSIYIYVLAIHSQHVNAALGAAKSRLPGAFEPLKADTDVYCAARGMAATIGIGLGLDAIILSQERSGTETFFMARPWNNPTVHPVGSKIWNCYASLFDPRRNTIEGYTCILPEEVRVTSEAAELENMDFITEYYRQPREFLGSWSLPRRAQ